MNRPIDFLIEDIQNLPDICQIAIGKVSIKAIRHLVKIKDKTVVDQHIVACENFKPIHNHSAYTCNASIHIAQSNTLVNKS